MSGPLGVQAEPRLTPGSWGGRGGDDGARATPFPSPGWGPVTVSPAAPVWPAARPRAVSAGKAPPGPGPAGVRGQQGVSGVQRGPCRKQPHCQVRRSGGVYLEPTWRRAPAGLAWGGVGWLPRALLGRGGRSLTAGDSRALVAGRGVQAGAWQLPGVCQGGVPWTPVRHKRTP